MGDDNNDGGNNNNNGGAGIMNQLAQTLANLVGNQQPRQQSLVSEFKRLSPPVFDGATDPTIVEKWVQEMEKAFDLLGSNEEQKVILGVYQLQGSAYDWWLMEKRKNEQIYEATAEAEREPYTWEKFKDALMDKYFPRTVRIQKEREFIRLEQGSKTVVEYEAEFARLSKYAPTLVADEASKARRLEEGLRENIRHSVAAFELPTYEAVLNKALVIERGLLEVEKKKENSNNKRSEPSSGPATRFGSFKRHNSNSGNGYGNRGYQGDRLKCTRCGLNHDDKDCRWNTGACFRCGEIGHRVAECPKKEKNDDTTNKVTVATLKSDYGRVFRPSPKKD